MKKYSSILFLSFLFAFAISGNAQTVKPQFTSSEMVVLTPEFPGGINAIRQFFKDSIECVQQVGLTTKDAYAGTSHKMNMEWLYLSLGADGTVKDIQLSIVLKREGPQSCFDKLKKMPAWIPPISEGKKVGSGIMLYVYLKSWK